MIRMHVRVFVPLEYTSIYSTVDIKDFRRINFRAVDKREYLMIIYFSSKSMLWLVI